MDDQHLDQALAAMGRKRMAVADPPALHERAMAVPLRTQSRSGLLPSLTGRFGSMFSAAKFVVAGAIVALFGGFLLAGALTQPTEEQVPAVGASVSSSADPTPVPQTPMPSALAITDLQTRSVGPGIVRVLGDGTGRNLDDLQMLFVASDGTVWAGRDKRVFRLSEPTSSSALPRTFNRYTFSTADSGNLRAANDRDGLLELRDGRWVELDPDTDKPYPVHPDASEWEGLLAGVGVRGVWSGPFHASDGSWWFGLADPSVPEVLRHTPDGAWERLPVQGAQGTAGQFIETPDGSLWATAGSGGISSALFRFDGERWERVEVPDDGTDFDAQSLRLDEQGGLVVNGMLFDTEPPRRVDVVREESGWSVTPFVGLADRYPLLEKADLSPLQDDDTGWAIAEDGKYLIYLDDRGATRLDVPFRADAITPSIHRYAVAPDGSFWFTIRSDHPSGNSSVGEGLYVITPDALAAAEPVAAQPVEDVEHADASTPDLLPGVDLVTEEVEPGVYRVDSDGVRDLEYEATIERVGDMNLVGMHHNVVAGLDGSVWLFGPEAFYRLGDGSEHGWPETDDDPQSAMDDIEIGPDGVMWRVPILRWGPLMSFDRGSWTSWRDRAAGVEVQSDGTVWAAWLDDDDRVKVGRVDGDGWDVLPGSIGGVPNPPGWQPLAVALGPGAEPWLPDLENGLQHFGGEGWKTEAPPVRTVARLDVAPDGTVWGMTFGRGPSGSPILARLDAGGWAVFNDILQAAGLSHSEGLLMAGPDGSIWISTYSPLATVCEGVSNFDGITLKRYLSDLCVYAMDVAPDGTVWLMAGEWPEGSDPSEAGPIRTYVITPEVVAG